MTPTKIQPTPHRHRCLAIFLLCNAVHRCTILRRLHLTHEKRATTTALVCPPPRVHRYRVTRPRLNTVHCHKLTATNGYIEHQHAHQNFRATSNTHSPRHPTPYCVAVLATLNYYPLGTSVCVLRGKRYCCNATNCHVFTRD